MTSNRFDFLEFNEQLPKTARPIVEESGEEVMRFDAPTVAKDAYVRQVSGLEEEVVYQRKTLKVMEVLGSRGTVAGAFNFPTGLAVDRSGILFVADSYNHRLQRITPDGGVAVIGGRGTGGGQFAAPMGVAVDEDRAFYVVEQGNHRIQKFDTDGRLQFTIGREGSRPGEFRSPTAIAVARGTKQIYVADTGNARVQCFSKEGVLISILGNAEGSHPRLTTPQAVTCDHNGNVYVADTLSHRLVRFDPGGRFTAFFGGPPSPSIRLPELNLSEPLALGFDDRGRLYVADGKRSQGRLTAINPETGTVHTVLENIGRGLGHLARPGGIAAAPVLLSKVEPGLERGDIYVSDTMNHRILRFVWS
jgi:DNA-binding beta-propeller fold protein YncE